MSTPTDRPQPERPERRASPGPDRRDAGDGATGSEVTQTPTAAPRRRSQQTPWPEGTKFGRNDKICAALIGVMALYGIAMMPLRPLLLGMAPIVLVAATGSMTATVACGALAATGRTELIPLAVVLGTLSIVKFDPVVWWAGRLWGDWFIASMVGASPRAQKRARRAETLARKYETIAIVAKYIPFVPIPSGIIFAVLGASGTRLGKFLAVDLTCALLTRAGYLYLGYRIGEPAVALLEEYSKYSWYFAIAMFVVIFVGAWRGAAKAERADAMADAAAQARDEARDEARAAEEPGRSS